MTSLRVPSNPSRYSNAFLFQWKKDKAKIAQLLQTLDDANPLTLILAVNKLVDIGKDLAHLHPMTFMTVALRDPVLRVRLQRIFQNALKQAAFMQGGGFAEGFRHRLDRESKRKNLEPYLVPFAKAIRVDPEEIRPWIQKEDWNALLASVCQKAFANEDRLSQA